MKPNNILRIILLLHVPLIFFDIRFLFILWGYIILFSIFRLWIYSSYFSGAQWIPSSKESTRRMLELADIKPNEVLYDLGSGDGRVVIEAAKNFKAKAIGIEIDPLRVLWSRFVVKKLGLSNRVKIIHGNFFNQNLGNADVVIVYLLPKAIEKLKDKLKRELRPGARVVSQLFKFEGWKLVREDRDLKIYVYKI
jgi:precorrin-6B methylase 2